MKIVFEIPTNSREELRYLTAIAAQTISKISWAIFLNVVRELFVAPDWRFPLHYKHSAKNISQLPNKQKRHLLKISWTLAVREELLEFFNDHTKEYMRAQFTKKYYARLRSGEFLDERSSIFNIEKSE